MIKRSFPDRFMAVFYPERCCCCGKVISCGEIICKNCLSELAIILPPVCHYCGRSKSECRCDKHQLHFERCVSPYYYQNAAKSALFRLKFSNKPYSAELFYLSMAEVVRREYGNISFDWIIPVPIGKATKKIRLYNQSMLLAQGLSKQLGIPYNDTLMKIWETSPQRELPAYRRSGNVLGVFDTDGKVDLTEKTILLVDDIATTGSTLDECAKILKIRGAQSVYAVTATASRLSNKEN